MPPMTRKPPPDPRATHATVAAPGRIDDAELRRRLGEHVRILGLVDLTDAELDAHLAAALEHKPSYTQVLERVLGQAAARRRERCSERRIVESGLPVRKTLANFDEYEQDHAEERAILRTLRQRWMARVCDDQVRGEDALRYVVEAARSMVKKEEPPASGGGT